MGLNSIFKRVILPYRLLIIDEFGYLPLKQEQANRYFRLLQNVTRRAASYLQITFLLGNGIPAWLRITPLPPLFCGSSASSFTQYQG